MQLQLMEARCFLEPPQLEALGSECERAGVKSEGGLAGAPVCIYMFLTVFCDPLCALFCWSGPFGPRVVPNSHHSLSVLRVS